jgi:DNA-binding FadR family transcriptional regulator
MRRIENRSADALRQALEDNIGSGLWEPGSRLPTERELSERYQIGRAVVRRVLGQLRSQGLITQTVGSGTFVCAAGPPERAAGQAERAAAPPGAPNVSPAHLMEARMLLEPAIIDMVVRNATTVDMARMEECCTHSERAITFAEFEHWDGILHKTIAAAAHNSLFDAVFDLMDASREQAEWGRLKLTSLTPERRLLYQREHRNLVAALKNRDGETAKRIASEHLRKIWNNLFGF